MTIYWKTKAEQEEHFHSIIHARRTVAASGRITAKELGKLSREVTDDAGMPNATIPGTARIDAMFSYAAKYGLNPPQHRLGKTGYRLGATLIW